MKKIALSLLFIIVFVALLSNNLYSVLSPTAAILSRGEARVYQKIYKNNSLSFGADVGLIDNFQFGVSYGAEQLVGDLEPEWRNTPDVNVRFRIINEDLDIPAIAIGIDTQGHGHFHKHYKRYDIMSKGAYIVGSKNFSFLGLMGFDFGLNFSFEHPDHKNHFDSFTGLYKTIGNDVTIYADYSFGFNDYKKGNNITGRGKGYLNTAVQLRLSDNLSMKLLMYDMLQNRRTTNLFDRALLIDYRWFF